ncbi:MAG: O-phosphoserine--tRNA ligase [Candidatus Syntropharchaeia archaeon]
MKFNPEEIKRRIKRDFEKTWIEGKKYLGRTGINERYPRLHTKPGKPHPVFETIQRLREAYMHLGFEEVINPVFVEERDVFKQFGAEALAVLDRCFYLSGLPHPNVGISEERISMMNEIFGKELSDEEVESLRKIFHGYKKGEIGGDDLTFEISRTLGVEDSKVVLVLDSVFPEFKNLSPIPTKNTLRSHMTSGWFITLEELWKKKPLPIKLFSVDRCFRREQREDATRLMNYHSASCVLCDEDVSVEHGKDVARGLLSQFGFRNFRFRPDEKRSKYYMPDTQIEVFAQHSELGWVEIATFGIYSPTALAQYDIPYPVMNLGLGVERLAMILYNESDMRTLVYPQFYAPWVMSDLEIAELIRVEKTPKTEEGWEIFDSIVRVCEEKGEERSPCQFEAWKGEIFGREITVSIVEPEENTKLCGPAYLNEIVVYGGDVLGIPRSEKWEKVFEEGTNTGIRFIDGFAALSAYEIEKATMEGKDCEIRSRIIKSPGDINVIVDPVALRYITSKNKKIDVRGPLFTTVRSRIFKNVQA